MDKIIENRDLRGIERPINPDSVVVPEIQKSGQIGRDRELELVTLKIKLELLKIFYVSSPKTNERGSSRSELIRSKTDGDGRWTDRKTRGIPSNAEIVKTFGKKHITIGIEE
jgi:hypothetical protein